TRSKRDWSSDVCSSDLVLLDQLLQQLVPIQLADQGAGVVVVGDIGRVLREDVPHDLIDGVVSFLLKGAVYGGQHLFDLRVLFIEIGRASCRERVGMWDG